MKIISLTAENVKKLSVVQITPAGNLVQITGKNGQGKSSVLDAIWWALAGTANIQKAPIRKGADEARIVLDLGEIIVRRTFKQRMVEDDQGVEKPDGSYITSIIVENADGARFPSPQKMLDGLLGSLAFDPLAFANMDAKAQFETLKRFVPDVDFAAIEKANAEDYAARTDLNRRAKDARAQAAGIAVPKDIPAEPIDEAALVARLEDAGRINSDLMQRQTRREQAAAEAKRLRAQAEAHRQSANGLRNQAAAEDDKAGQRDQEAEKLETQLKSAPELPPPVDTAEIRALIDKARTLNKSVADAARRKQFDATADTHEAAAKKLTKAMEKREADKRKAIAEAKLPVAGIEFGDGVIVMNGVPFDQASDAEKLRASVAIAMAANPKLRVIRVRDGSLLDEEGLALLAKMADEADCQVWIERVDSSGKIGFVLEDGHLKAEEQRAAAE